MIGRFGTIDPLAEKDRKWSPYSYGHNNPISHIDVDGMFDMVRLTDGTVFDDKSVNSQAEVTKKYDAGAKMLAAKLGLQIEMAFQPIFIKTVGILLMLNPNFLVSKLGRAFKAV